MAERAFGGIVVRCDIEMFEAGEVMFGGDAIDVTSVIHSGFKKIAIQLTHDMGLRFCGVDLMTRGDITGKPSRYWILEVNAAPGLDHYAKTGKVQEKIVEHMYLTVLKAMQ